MSVEHARLPEAPLKAACSLLMSLVLLAMLSLGRAEVPVFAGAASGVASAGVERSGEAAALLRITGKGQALEVRSGRPALVKFAGGHPVLPARDTVFSWFVSVPPAEVVAADRDARTPWATANQPRAPPSVPA
ncbi:hypothetical protein FJ942_17630 [Mesorhizobium sp. B2-4-2]|uniref:hypothetical protein n=1 Tax=unclassified Mesorhizobium TaxID=325217 RepID=UPI00112E069B|nr:MULTISPECIES: hypothetical protein [unclassified Mesorhizobium]MBZ9958162.1 hypothetical protein [Mesorhizobium sp. BR1-1-14]TPK38109.1 hypothetical protein FJ867_12695 [Mesorhizobium sp. B2-5-3]TPL55517.1 hypothetical protein FJ942_17630 [Mesorhizobium sp. B2-4-2]